jgi:hypothetical protein
MNGPVQAGSGIAGAFDSESAAADATIFPLLSQGKIT